MKKMFVLMCVVAMPVFAAAKTDNNVTAKVSGIEDTSVIQFLNSNCAKISSQKSGTMSYECDSEKVKAFLTQQNLQVKECQSRPDCSAKLNQKLKFKIGCHTNPGSNTAECDWLIAKSHYNGHKWSTRWFWQ